MKYGILTFHNIPNIGAMLQAYALCMELRKLGLDCEIINYECENIKKRERTFKTSKNLLKTIISYLFIWPGTYKKIKDCDEFMQSQNICGNHLYNRTNIKESLQQYDGFISGSDMIWNLDITDHDWTYFLDFATDDKPKYSFSSSIGSTWDDGDIKNVKKLLDRYKCIGTRESDTCDYINNNLGITCYHTPDPTVLLSSEDWSKLIISPPIDNYCLVYFTNDKILNSAKEYAKVHKKTVVVVNNGLPIKGVKNVPIYEPGSWLGYISNADAVFTNSYHGLLFSLYFEKAVWTANYGNRISSLLKQLGLENCFIDNDKTYENKIDYVLCNKKIDEMRQYGINYIKNIMLE